ncbi:MAG TPA: hypothetical protein VF487_10765 [Chitinophagaceae bacterium]
MTKANKNITALLFMAVGCIPWLFVLLFCIQQQNIRHRMKEKLEENIPPYTICIPDNEINWIEKGEEIWVNGKLFDIKTSRHKNGIITFTGLYDENETALEIKLDREWQKRSSNDSRLLSDFFQTLQNFFFETEGDENIELLIAKTLSLIPIPALCSPCKIVLTPPPQV